MADSTNFENIVFVLCRVFKSKFVVAFAFVVFFQIIFVGHVLD